MPDLEGEIEGYLDLFDLALTHLIMVSLLVLQPSNVLDTRC